MYKAPGRTIKSMIYAITIISWVAIALAVILICVNVDNAGVCILAILIGLVLAALVYFSNIVLYAFGQLVDDVQKIRKIFEQEQKSPYNLIP